MEVEFYPSSANKRSVTNFIKTLDFKMQKKIIRELEKVEEYGNNALKAYDSKKVKSDKDFWEMRFEHNKIDVRLCYIIKFNKLWILHGFIKKKQKTPLKEIKLTVDRIKELEENIFN